MYKRNDSIYNIIMLRPPRRPEKLSKFKPGEKTYSSFDIMRALQIPKEKLRDWIDRGFVPSTKPSPGRGLPAVYTKWDVYGLALFMELLSHGFPRDRASSMAKDYRDEYDIYYPGDAESEPDVWTIFKPADYILFRREVDEDGNVNIRVSGAANDEWNVSLSTGDIYPEDAEHDYPGHPDLKPWSSILIIDYKKIRNSVDEALGKL